MAASFEESEKLSGLTTFTQITSIWWKNRENRSSRSWDSFAEVKKKEITEGKIYSPVGHLAERAKLVSIWVLDISFACVTTVLMVVGMVNLKHLNCQKILLILANHERDRKILSFSSFLAKEAMERSCLAGSLLLCHTNLWFVFLYCCCN